MTILHTVSLETEAFWAKMLLDCDNPLGINNDMLEESKETCPPVEYENARYLGRYLVPRSILRYNDEEQPRDKNNDQDHVSKLMNDFEVNGYNINCPPPICCYDYENNNDYSLKGQSGFNSNELYTRLGQEKIIVDIYDYDSRLWEVVARNQSNHHANPSLVQTKNDYIKEVCNAVDSEIIESTADAINSFVDLIAKDKTSNIRKQIKDTCYNNCSVFPNFRTYSSSGTVKSKNTLKGFLRNHGFPAAGIENRTDEELLKQGYILYCAGNGGNKATWMRGIVHGIQLGIPVWIFGYAPVRKEDLKEFRESWIEEFEELKETTIQFASTILSDCDSSDFDENNFPVKVAGFLPQYIKPNPKDGGTPTEKGLVDTNGTPITFNRHGDCLTTR